MQLACRVFPFDEHRPRHPEQDLWPAWGQRAPVGIAFSGGGTRSACLTLGTLRALKHLGLLERTRVLSAASGGAWCAVPFTFLPAAVDEARWLGAPLEPEALTPAILDAPEDSFAARCTAAPLAQLYAQHLGAGDERFGRAIGHVFLRPDRHTDTGRLFTMDAASRTRLETLNRSRPLPGPLTVVERADRPFLVVGGALFLDDQSHADADVVPFEMTPLYAGVAAAQVRARDHQRFGGGFVESCGYDSAHRTGAGALRVCDLSDCRFTLHDMVGTTGAAPALLASLLGVPTGVSGLPRFHTWALHGTDADPLTRARELRAGDGGLWEHNGVVSLLVRGLRRVVAFVNTADPPSRCIDLARLFDRTDAVPVDAANPVKQGMAVFPRGDYPDLVAELHRDGVALREHELLPCPRAGFRPAAGERATVLWVYNPDSSQLSASAWWAALPQETQRLLLPGLGQRPDLATFPRVATFFPQPGVVHPDKVIELSRAQARLLACWSDWRVGSPESEGGILEPLCALFDENPAVAATRLARARS